MSALSMDFSYKPKDAINSGKNLLWNIKDELGSLFSDSKKTIGDGVSHTREFGKNFVSNGFNFLKNRIKSFRNMIGNAIEWSTALVPIVNWFGKKIADVLRADAWPSTSHAAPAHKKEEAKPAAHHH